MFTEYELKKLHQHFNHPLSSRLYRLLQGARPAKTTKDTLQILEKIAAACRTCTTLGARLLRFRVAIPLESITFSKEVALEVFLLDGRGAINVVETHNGYDNTAFLRG